MCEKMARPPVSEITVRPHKNGFIAGIGLGTENSAYGTSQAEAIGELVMLHGAKLGVQVRIIEKPAPRRKKSKSKQPPVFLQHHSQEHQESPE